MRPSSLVAILALALVPFMPGVEAAMIQKYDVDLRFPAIDFGSESEGGGGIGSFGLSLVTGRLDASGERGGLFGIVGVTSGSITSATKIDVINAQDQQGAVDRAIRGECSDPQSCAVERTFSRANATVAANGNLLLYADVEPLNFTAVGPFSLATVFRPPADLGGEAAQNLTFETSMLAVGGASRLMGSLAAPTQDLFAFLPDDNSSLLITDGVTTTEYRGRQYLFRFYGEPDIAVEGSTVVFPFAGDVRAFFRPATGQDLRDHFRLEAVNDVFRTFGSSETVVDDTIAKQFRQLAPILNGVFFGNASQARVNEESIGDSDFALLRFGSVELTPLAPGGRAVGQGGFLLFEDGFYTTQKGSDLGFAVVPSLSFVLWVVAAGAIVAGFVLKPTLAPKQLGGFGTVRLVAFAFHLVALVLAIVLWDQEVKAFLGTSLLTLFTEGAFGQQVSLGVTAVFELVPFFLALLLFGMPVRFIVNSILKLGGLQKARGIGKGIGDLAVWGIGAAFIPLLLNSLVGAIMGAFQGLLS